MLKITDGKKTIYDGTPLNVKIIYACINHLRELIKKLDGYPDNSLFFQNPLIIEGWIQLIRTFSTIEKWKSPTDDAEWEVCEEQYVAYLLSMRTIWEQYRDLALEYYKPLKELMKCYLDCGWLSGDCISDDGIEALCEDHYEKELKDVSDMFQHLAELKKSSHEGRSNTYKTLSGIQDLLDGIIKRGVGIIYDLNPLEKDFANAINADLRTRTRLFKEKMIKEMEEELARNYSEDRTKEDYKPELWGKMLTADEEALNLAKRKKLSECNAPKQEHWGKDMKAMMDANGNLMELILSTIKNKELIDLGKAENIRPFITLLTPENLSMFYHIIVRRSLIQCEMFPELKAQHEAWLNNVKEQLEDVDETGLEPARQSKLNEIIGILQKGNWKQPATADNVELLLNTIFGKDTSLLDEEDANECEKMWALVEGGKGKDRKVIVSAKLAGFMGREENLMKNNGPKAISEDLFGKNNNQSSAINKGKMGCSNDFDTVIPFLKKYINKIIRQG